MSDPKPQWMTEHEESDRRAFGQIDASINEMRKEMNAHMKEIKPYLQAAAAFKIGAVGIRWFGGFLIALGTLIALGLQIFH